MISTINAANSVAENDISLFLLIIFLVVMLGIVLYKILINKLIDFISICLGVINLAVLIIPAFKEIKALVISLIIIDYLWLVLANIQYFIYLKIQNIRKIKLVEQIKNDTSDFYLCLNNKNQVIDYSGNFTKLTKLNHKAIYKKDGWTLLFKYFNVLKIDGNEFVVSNQVYFKDHIYDNLSKFKLTEFTFDILNDENKLVHYLGYIQGHYFSNFLVSKAIYLYQDKSQAVTELNNNLKAVTSNLNLHHEVLSKLMALTNDTCLYFDYQDRLYHATKSFMEFVGMEKSSYTFTELFNMMPVEDQNEYVNQSEMINCHCLTKIKYHINIKNRNYDVVEDSIYLGDSQELVSIIHIMGLSEEEHHEEILSTVETVDLMEQLASNPLNGLADKTLDTLEKTLRINNDEK